MGEGERSLREVEGDIKAVCNIKSFGAQASLFLIYNLGNVPNVFLRFSQA